MPSIILDYSDDDFKKVEERAFINSRTIGVYFKRLLGYPCDSFSGWHVSTDAPTGDIPSVEPLKAEKDESTEAGEPEIYQAEHPYKSRRKPKRKYVRKIKQDTPF